MLKIYNGATSPRLCDGVSRRNGPGLEPGYLPSLKEVLFVAQGSVHVIHYRRQSDDTWILSETRDLADRVVLTSIEVEIPLTEVYAKVRFEEPSGPTAVPG